MSLELQRYTEPLGNAELMFLVKKEHKERRQFYKVYRILMIFSFVIPFIGAWGRAFEGAPNAFAPVKFFAGAGVLLFISSFATGVAYYINLRKVQLDIKHRTKTIEISHITRKLHIAAKNAWYFYINSRTKLSIEVSGTDYEQMNEGDEVCIEYTTHSRMYLGYF